MTKQEALKVIGGYIKAYGHFEDYQIPNTEGATANGLLVKICEYFDNDNANNKDYGEGVVDCQKVKRFILSRATESGCMELGKEWMAEFMVESGLRLVDGPVVRNIKTGREWTPAEYVEEFPELTDVMVTYVDKFFKE